MDTVINLRQARKQKDRAERARIANENALRFGRTKAERNLQKAQAEKAARDLALHKRDPE